MANYIYNSIHLVLVQLPCLLQLLDVTAGLTLAPTPAVATVRQVSRSAPVPAAAIVQQQGALFGTVFPCCTFTQGMQGGLSNKL